MMNAFIRVALAQLLALLAVSAQDKVSVRFAAQVAPPKLGKLVMVAGELKSEGFELPVNYLTEPQEVPARAFTIQREEEPGTLAKVVLPESGAEFIVLLVPGTEAGFEAVVIPARGASFRPGDYYVHNTSKKVVLGKVGTTKFVVPSRKGQVVRPAGAREERFYDVLLGVREGNESRPISTSRWPVGNQTRTYVFFFDNPKRKDVDFRAIDEFVPPEEKED